MHRFLRFLIGLLVGFGCGFIWSVEAVSAGSADRYAAAQSGAAAGSGSRPRSALGDSPAWQACWANETGLPAGVVSAAASSLHPDELVTHLELRLSPQLARTVFHVPGAPSAPLEMLLDAEVPLWRFSTLGDHLSAGEALSISSGTGACLPYPVHALSMTAQPLIRGQTAALRIETDGLAFCRASYLDRSERCYREDATTQIVLIAVSALAEPGIHPLEIALVSGGAEVAFTLPLEVAAGRYGFQYIDPPASLLGLMDADLMASEAAYLEQWRALRSQERMWQLPLGRPLEQRVSISADFGDRRSYGGMVSGYHSGVDYRAWTGLPVVSPADAVVVMAETLRTRGNAVLLDHGWGLVTGYWHLSQIDVAVGDFVAQGQRFATVGNTGLSTGSHLHWEVWVNGVSVDGKQWLDAEGLAGVVLSPYEGARRLTPTVVSE